MDIERDAIAGTLESSDVLVRVSPHPVLEVDLTSAVEAQYGDDIRQLIDDTLRRLGVQAGRIVIEDRGALDCTVRARLEAAVARSTDQPLDYAALGEA
ncbi:MAG: citrate lyase acyl carrier protein [Propionibacteriaceae bacterium]|jgi:citrate lyase subunit gamma (acyl carrier protein)|nr:citrate lyase acyl carrier protein [Propionibacteriaceae bacterium]